MKNTTPIFVVLIINTLIKNTAQEIKILRKGVFHVTLRTSRDSKIDKVEPTMNNMPVSLVTTTLVWVTKNTVISDRASQWNLKTLRHNHHYRIGNQSTEYVVNAPRYGRMAIQISRIAGEGVSISTPFIFVAAMKGYHCRCPNTEESPVITRHFDFDRETL